MASNNSSIAIQHTQDWLDQVVVGLNLCPFAATVVNDGTVQFIECSADQTEQQLQAVLKQLDTLQQTDETSIATSLLVFSNGLSDFEHYWDFVEIAEELLEKAGLNGIIQLASFHPNYLFEGVNVDDASHFSNRSPYPMLHFIREAQLTRALANYPNPEAIPDINIEHLRKLGKPALLALLSTITNTP